MRLFLEAYALATGERFAELHDCETPDFMGHDENERIVGIEITTLRFAPDERHMRRIFPPGPHDIELWYRLAASMDKKQRTLPKGYWAECERKILVIMALDAPIPDIVAGIETDTPEKGGFSEAWLADYTQAEPFGAVDLFAVIHPTLTGHFATGDRGQKPYG